jgi:hypothetical protein
MATDNVYPSLTTGFQRIYITVGLATAYASSGTCSMPYPATPMFYPGDSTGNNWSVTASGALAGQFSILPASATGGGSLSGSNDVLVGCPVGVPSGTYQLTFNISSSGDTLTLPLQVVGQDTQDNGSVNISPGTNLPPIGNQQGVLASGQIGIFLAIGPPYEFNTDSGFSGNFLFGFNGIGVDPDGCGTAAAFSDGVYLSAAPSNPGRYDLLFDGTTSACPTAFPAPFPTSPAPIVFASADVLYTSVPWNGSTVSGVQLGTSASNPGPQMPQNLMNVLDIQQQTGANPPATIPVTVAFTGGGASNSILFGLSTDYTPQACLSNPSGPGSTSVNVPNVPGRYYIAIDTSQGACFLGNWASGTPGVSQFIGIVDVWSAPPAGLLGSPANFTTSETGSVIITPLGGPTDETVNGGTIFGFCVVAPIDAGCADNSGVSGSVAITANQVSFTFYGSTSATSGTFVITISGFTTMINNVTLAPGSGSLSPGTFGLTSFTSNSMTFTGTVSSTDFSAIGGQVFTFNVN